MIWDAPSILEAVGRNPATCDEIYKAAAEILASATDGAPLAEMDISAPDSKAGPRVLVACLTNWSAEIGLPWVRAVVWCSTPRRWRVVLSQGFP